MIETNRTLICSFVQLNKHSHRQLEFTSLTKKMAFASSDPNILYSRLKDKGKPEILYVSFCVPSFIFFFYSYHLFDLRLLRNICCTSHIATAILWWGSNNVYFVSQLNFIRGNLLLDFFFRLLRDGLTNKMKTFKLWISCRINITRKITNFKLRLS